METVGLFSCERFQGLGLEEDGIILYCVFQKMLLLVSVTVISLQVYQTYVSNRDYFMSLAHPQMLLYYFSICSNLYLFCTMGLMSTTNNRLLIPTVEIFRILKFLSLFQFFVHRAEGLYEMKYLNNHLVLVT
jgi:hypothetical protein